MSLASGFIFLIIHPIDDRICKADAHASPSSPVHFIQPVWWHLHGTHPVHRQCFWNSYTI